MLFKDRKEAGQKLASLLSEFRNDKAGILLALPRGGVVLGYEMSQALHLPLDIILVRKLGVPWQEELAFGAIGTEGVQVLNQDVVEMLGIDSSIIDKVARRERAELLRRNSVYRQGRPFPQLSKKHVILVDDGIATGATMRAAIQVVKTFKPETITLAAPVASKTIYQEMAEEKVTLRLLATPSPFLGIGMWYQAFPQVSDQEVMDLLARAHTPKEDSASP